MLGINYIDSAEAAFVRIYTSINNFGELPTNKTVDLGEVCEQIGQIKLSREDLSEALHFYREAEELVQGEKNKQDIQSVILSIEDRVRAELDHDDAAGEEETYGR